MDALEITNTCIEVYTCTCACRRDKSKKKRRSRTRSPDVVEKKIVDIEQFKEERRLGQFQRHVFFLLTMVC